MPGIVGKIGVFNELVAQSDGRSVQRIVGTAGELNETAAFETLAIGRALVAEIGAGIVQVEWMASRRRIEAALAFTDWQERSGFGANGRERHQDHGLVGERGGY